MARSCGGSARLELIENLVARTVGNDAAIVEDQQARDQRQDAIAMGCHQNCLLGCEASLQVGDKLPFGGQIVDGSALN